MLQSPSFIHLDLDFCLSNDSWAWAVIHKDSCSCFLLKISWSVSCLCSVSSSSLFNSASRFWTFLKLSPYCSLFHLFSLCFSLLIFSFNTYAPHPETWTEFQHWCTTSLKDFSVNQQSSILKGLGPQSTLLALSRIG